VRATIESLESKLDLETLLPDAGAETLAFNDLGTVRIAVGRALIADRYADNRATGSFILIDEATHHTVAAGMISEVANGRVYLVGAGPGAPDSSRCAPRACSRPRTSCSTMRSCIRKRSPSRRARARSASESATARSRRAALHQPRVDRGGAQAWQRRAAEGGDPMLFGRAQEEIEALGAAESKWSRARRDRGPCRGGCASRFSHAPRHRPHGRVPHAARGKGETASEWLPAALGADSVVLYMAAGASQAIAAALIGAGKPASTPVALVESATLAGEKRVFTTLEALRATCRRAATGRS